MAMYSLLNPHPEPREGDSRERRSLSYENPLSGAVDEFSTSIQKCLKRPVLENLVAVAVIDLPHDNLKTQLVSNRPHIWLLL